MWTTAAWQQTEAIFDGAWTFPRGIKSIDYNRISFITDTKAGRLPSMFLRFSINVPENRTLYRYGQSRELVAKAAQAIGDQEFVRFLLWVDESHTPRSGLAPFRYTTARRGKSLDILALGQPAVEQLLAKGHLISTALAQEFGTSPCDGREMGMCSIDFGRTPIHYRMPRMIIQKYQYEKKFGAAEREHKSGKTSEILLDHVAQVIGRDLVRQAELMAVDIPEEIQIGNVVLDDLKPVRVVPGRYNLSAAVRFSMSHKLRGPWAAGHLAARGYGRILAAYSR
jgi:hypothetical protein